MHVGWAVGVGAGLVRYARSPTWRAAGAVYPLTVVLVVVVTGNHFLFDAAAGMLVMALGFRLADLLEKPHGATLLPASRGGAVR